MQKGIMILDKAYQDLIYPDSILRQIKQYIDIVAQPIDRNEIMDYKDVLYDCEVIFSGWGCVRFDKQTLDLMPNLKAVFYGAGSIKGLVTDEFWNRNIVITSAYGANAVPVAEYTLSQILFGLKGGYRQIKAYKESKKRPERTAGFPLGCYKTTVGIISLGMIGKLVCEHLKHFDMNVIAYDPFASESTFRNLGVKKADTLEEVFQKSDVVSLHTPWLAETENMITGAHFELMKKHAVFINTSRGAIVNEKEMIERLKKRNDILAVLDVTWPEPPKADSPLYYMDNVILTPHIAGTMENECARMGQFMADELQRYIKGEPLIYKIDKEKSIFMA